MRIKCTPLGAGQDIGKSCVLVSLGPSCNVLFDCGMHMGHTDERRYPDFAALPRLLAGTKGGARGKKAALGQRGLGAVLETLIDCVIVTHIHMDHCGALPYFTEVLGYRGPIYMTYPTMALAALMMEDYRKVMVDKRGEKETEHYTAEQIQASVARVTPLDINETVHVTDSLVIKPFYAGHVLGAAMFYARELKTGASVLYTGDYSMSADRHLRPASVPAGLSPDLLITESTYATTIRESRRSREMEFLQKVHACIRSGGHVLIPVFALGRAQELCILLDEYWEAQGISAPIYFSAGLASQANVFYQTLLTWTNEKVQEAHGRRNTFDFKNVIPYHKSTLPLTALPPCVLFATPGMLTGGLSLEAFVHWAPHASNLVVLPGVCLAGTVGRKLQSLVAGGGAGPAGPGAPGAGAPGPGGKGGAVHPSSHGLGKLNVDKHTEVRVNCQVHQLSFSPHTDSKGILDLVHNVRARNVLLVHGEKAKMAKLKARITDDLGIPCFDPPNLSTVSVPFTPSTPVALSAGLAARARGNQLDRPWTPVHSGSAALAAGEPLAEAEPLQTLEAAGIEVTGEDVATEGGREGNAAQDGGAGNREGEPAGSTAPASTSTTAAAAIQPQDTRADTSGMRVVAARIGDGMPVMLFDPGELGGAAAEPIPSIQPSVGLDPRTAELKSKLSADVPPREGGGDLNLVEGAQEEPGSKGAGKQSVQGQGVLQGGGGEEVRVGERGTHEDGVAEGTEGNGLKRQGSATITHDRSWLCEEPQVDDLNAEMDAKRMKGEED